MPLQNILTPDNILTTVSLAIIAWEICGRVYRWIDRAIRHRRRMMRLADPAYNRERFSDIQKEIE